MERKFTDQETIRREKLKKLQESNKDPFVITKFIRNYNSQSFKEEFERYTKEELHDNKTEVLIAGRLMLVRQTFGVVKDFFGKFQIYVNKKTVSAELWELFSKTLDIGDIIGIKGRPMKTNTGEVTVNVDDITLLSKSLKVLPEKFHGLTDEEARARQRYVDLIVNEESLDTFVKRSKLSSVWRKYLTEQGFLEVDTPVLQPIYGGAAAKPFTTHHNALDRQYFLRIAPELPLKKLIVGGFEKVFEFSRNFRNEGMDATHNPEFTGFELYWAYVSLDEIMDITETLFRISAKSLNKEVYKFRGFDIDLSKPFRRVTMVDCIKEATKNNPLGQVDFTTVKSNEEAEELAKKHGITLEGHQHVLGHIITLFFEKYGEETCVQPTFVHTYPSEVSPLTKKNRNDPRFTDRFELFIGQKEFANAYSELNDPIDQLSRFEDQMKEKELGASEDWASEIDMDFINAMEYGLPPTGGLGIGFDRFCMLLTEHDSMRDILLFPHMKDEVK